jgi:hypothetical protein
VSRNDENLHQRSVCDGLGDDGELFRIRVTALVERGWTATEIAEDVKAQHWRYAIPPDWDDKRIQREIEACGATRAPQEPRPAAKQIWDDGLPDWLRDCTESVVVPADPDQYFRAVVGALACRGWDNWRIVVKIVGRPWVPTQYATAGGRHLEYAVQTVLMAVSSTREALANQAMTMTLARNASGSVRTDKIESDDAAPDGLRPPATVTDATAESKDAIAAWIADRCERDASSWESSAALFASWTTWAKGAGEADGSQRRFVQALESRGFQSQRKRHGRGLLGLRIVPVDGGKTRGACDAMSRQG